jgi:hypothetical protein
MNIRGVYKWKLVNKDTGEIESKGEQENLITDSFTKNFINSNGQSKDNHYGRIVLSKQSTPLPSLEFREYGVASSNISRDVVSGQLTYTYDDAAGIQTCNNNFSAPGTPQTYTIFGLDLGYRTISYYYYEFQSFVVLTTPVTQLTTQLLFVEYSMYVYYSAGLLNSPFNSFISAYMNSEIFERMQYLAYRIGSGSPENNHLHMTPFRNPVTLNNVGRRVGSFDNFQSSSCPNDGCRYGQTPQKSYLSSDFAGPIGIPIWLREYTYSPYENAVLGTFNSAIAPSISRVYIHPAAQYAEIFSDPSNPPSSRASITLTGTPTIKVPTTVRLEITKTGDASDITDETFTANPTTDELTVSQDEWAVDDIVQFTTTGTLPSPLATSTNYYIVTKTGTSPTVLIEVSLSQGGAVVDITDAGTGTHTISRQNTGEYRLTMQPTPTKLESNQVGPALKYYQIFAMTDSDSEVMPNNDRSIGEYALIGREGDYIYTVQYDATGNQLMICRQVLFTPECSMPLHSLFGTSGLTVYRALRGKGTYSDMVYIATSVGIYSYDFSSPATPTLMTITGMLSSDVRELAFDEITEYLWAGHYQGMSRIDLSTNTATQYNNGVGDPLQGISSTYIECRPGCLSAHNGYVYRMQYNQDEKWLLQDGVGYAYTSSYGYSYYGGRIRTSNGHIVTRTNTAWYVLSVSGITGPGTGSWTVEESYNPGVSEISNIVGQLIALSDTRYMAWVNISSYMRLETYEIGGTYIYQDVTTDLVPTIAYGTLSPYTGNARNVIDVSEGSMNLYAQFFSYAFLAGSLNQRYGWSGSAWVKDNSTTRQIIETGTHSLGNGVSVQFNNAVGEDWDDQFVLGEFFTFMIAPVLIKDNLQEYSIKARAYYCAVKRVTNWTTTIAATVTVPEAPTGSSPDADYRDLDTDTTVLEVYNVTTATTMTQVASPPGDEQYSVTGLLDGTFEFHANQIGDTVRISYNYTCYW